jgi:ribose transport system permease protein
LKGKEDMTEKITIAEEFQQRVKAEYKNARIVNLAPTILFVAIVILFAIMAPGFASVSNFFTLLNQMSIPLIICTGITFVLLIGSIDLSVNGVMSLAGALSGLLVLNDKTDFNLNIFGLVLAVAVAGACGFVTGIIFVKGKIPSFMVSYAMSAVCYGFGMLSYGALPPIIEDEMVRDIALKKVGGLPIFFYIAIALFVIALLIQEKTTFGKHIYAVGENEMLAKQSGVYVDRLKISVFVIAGIFVGIAAVCSAAQIGRGDVVVGENQIFPALAAVVVGGTSLSGGKGGVMKTLLGVAIITVLNNGLVLIGANPYIKDGVMGAILIIAVIAASSRKAKMIVK